MKVKQATLFSENEEVMTTWLDVQPGLKLGAVISLKDLKPDTKWTVVALYEHEHEAADFDFHRKWDNNNYDKHTGLSL